MWMLIIARAGRMRDGLQSLLSAFLHGGTIDVVEDGRSILEKYHADPPILVFMDSSLPFDQVLETLCLIKSTWAKTRCIVIVEKIQQIQPVLETGGDKVLLKGFSAAQLSQLVQPYA